MDEQPAAEERVELPLDEAGQPYPVGARGGCGEKGLQVLVDHPVQDRVGGGAGDVGSHGAGRSGFRAVPIAAPQDVRDDGRPEVIPSECNRIAATVARTRHRKRSP